MLRRSKPSLYCLNKSSMFWLFMAHYGLSGIFFFFFFRNFPSRQDRYLRVSQILRSNFHPEWLAKAEFEHKPEQLMFRARTDTLWHCWDLNSRTIRGALKITLRVSRRIDFLSSYDGRPIKPESFLNRRQDPQAVSDEVWPKTTQSFFPPHENVSQNTHTHTHSRLYALTPNLFTW